MEVNKIPKYSKLSKSERVLICKWRDKGYSNKKIARLLGRSCSTIGREISRNKFKGFVYEPLHAQALFEKRKLLAWGAKKSLKNKDIYSYVLGKLREGWSPETISGRLRERDHKGEPDWQICSETIYHFIYSKKNKDKKLWHYLRRKQVRRRLKGGRKVTRVRIPDRVSIHLRPAVVNERAEVGHWEGDSVVGKYKKSGLHTEYERVTSMVRFERLLAITADETIKAQIKIFEKLPEDLRKSDTLDNGLEMVKHHTLTEKLNMTTYFADPYSSWQRGGNENGNMWIRYYFPKGTDFSTISDQELKDVEEELNNRPRKRLEYRTPLEVFNKYLKGCTSN